MNRTLILTGMFFAIVSCKKNDVSSDKGIVESSIFSGERVLEKELTKEGGLYYYNGKPFNGIGFKMYDEKNIKFEKNYIDGKIEGELKFWHKNGQLGKVFYGKNDKKEGKYTTWYENGQMEEQMAFLDGKHNGIAKGWYENGVQKFEKNYTIIKEKNYDIGETDVKKGPSKTVISDTGTYNNSSVNVGEYKEWYKNGQLKLKCNYNDKGELDGISTKWLENGNVYEKVRFENNKKTELIQN